ncbi:MAG TPA: hypothetical protein ENI23_16495 [bacterium]|nr:hypothetical protein [bacterium]
MAKFRPKSFQPDKLSPTPQNIGQLSREQIESLSPEQRSKLSAGQRFALGARESAVRNVGEERATLPGVPQQLSNVPVLSAKPETIRGISETVQGVAPIVGSFVPGGPASTAAVTGAAGAFGESLENLFGVQEQTTGQLATKAVVDPAIAGATDLAAQKAISIGGQAVGKLFGKMKSFIVPKNAPSKLFQSVFALPRKIAERINVPEMSDELVKHNISGSLEDMQKIAGKVTGKDGIISVLTRKLLGKTRKPIVVTNALDAANNAALDATNVDNQIIKKVIKKITRMIGPNRPTGLNVGEASAIDSFDIIRSLEKEGYELINKSTDLSPNISVEQQGKIYLSAADDLKDQIDVAQLAEGVIEKIKTPETFRKLREISTRLVKQVNQTKNLRELRSVAKPFVDLSQASRITLQQSESGFIKALGKKPIGLLEIPGAIASNVSGRADVRTFVAQLIRKQFPSIPVGDISKAIELVMRGGVQATQTLVRGELGGEQGLSETPQELTPENSAFLRR